MASIPTIHKYSHNVYWVGHQYVLRRDRGDNLWYAYGDTPNNPFNGYSTLVEGLRDLAPGRYFHSDASLDARPDGESF
jgi:hypothetical protein